MPTVADSYPDFPMPTVADPGIKAMRSDGGGGVEHHSSFSERFLEWGNSPGVAIFWAIIGCMCSLLCPMFLILEEGQAFSDPGPIRMMIMLIVCFAMAVIYRVGYTLRHHRIMRERPDHVLGYSIGMVSSSIVFTVLSSTVINGGSWSTVVWYELLLVAFFVLLEMGRPVFDFYMLRNLLCIPFMAAARGDRGWDFIYLGWPMITVVLPLLLMMWREFFIFNHKGKNN